MQKLFWNILKESEGKRIFIDIPGRIDNDRGRRKGNVKIISKTQRQFILCVYYKDKIIASAGIMPWMEKKKFCIGRVLEFV